MRRKPDLNRELLGIMVGIACALVAAGTGLGWVGGKFHRGRVR